MMWRVREEREKKHQWPHAWNTHHDFDSMRPNEIIFKIQNLNGI